MANQQSKPHARNFQDLTGKRFGRLLVLYLHDRTDPCHLKYLCRCDCGTEKLVRVDHLRYGFVVSCGCFLAERIRTHGHTINHDRSPEYATWMHMKQRCYNTKSKGYPRYGGKGITICQRWLDSFEDFFADMGRKPSSHHSIDRIDGRGIYEPSNCRWATPKEQARNFSRNRRFSFDGKCFTISEWAELTGIHKSTIRYRIEHGWATNQVLLPPENCRL